MTRSNRVLLLGDLAVDVMMPIRVYPQPGDDCMADNAFIRAGGGAGNTACILAGLGLQAQPITRTGSDILAEFELGELEKAGVDVSEVRRDDRVTTGLTFVPVIPGGERTLISHRGANRATSPEDISPSLFQGAGLLHLLGYSFLVSPQREAAWKAVELARQSGVPVSLDSSMEPVLHAGEEIRRMLKTVQIAVLGVDEVHSLFGPSEAEPCADILLAQGIQLAAIKLGGRGCFLATPHERISLPAFAVDTVDATGAGDGFSAGLIYAHLRGLSLAAAGVLANTIGALVTTVWGGGCGRIDTGTVSSFLHDQLQGSRDSKFDAPVREILASLEDRSDPSFPVARE